MLTATTRRPPLTPRHWPGWLAVGLLWVIGKTPQRVGVALSTPLAWLLARLMKGRRRIAERNIERCFPEFSADQRRELIEENFRSLARMVFEVTWSWSASVKKIEKMGSTEGTAYAFDAMDQCKGVLIITAHLTCLEIGGRILALNYPDASGIYRPLKSPVLEWYQNRSRAKYTAGTISKRDMRSAIRFLRKGGVLWYAPDQDFGPKQSVFVPFFGIRTATLTATAKLIEMTGCKVVPMFPMYDTATRKYTVKLYPALENFPSGDIVADLTRINAMMEEHIRRLPGQYWWIHRRFKTRPEGEPPFYD
jgi:KDO2-lipid IV(A) lauroyltransferase